MSQCKMCSHGCVGQRLRHGVVQLTSHFESIGGQFLTPELLGGRDAFLTASQEHRPAHGYR